MGHRGERIGCAPGEKLFAKDTEALLSHILAKILAIGNLQNHSKQPKSDRLSSLSFRRSLALVLFVQTIIS